MRSLDLLRQDQFRYVTLATLISVLGDGLMRVALPLQVLAIAADDPLAISAVGTAWMVGHAASLPVGGVTSDRRDRRSIMIASDLVRAGAIGAMGLLGTAGALRVGHMLVLGAVFGFANGFFNPAARSIVPDLVSQVDLARANALLGFARPLQLWIVGPLIAGLIIAVAGPAVALLVDALTFVLSALLLRRLTPRGPALRSGAQQRLSDDLREGLAFVRRTPWARRWFTALALSTLAFHGSFDVLVPTMLKVDLGLSEAQAGWWIALLFTAGGVGALVASTVIAHRDLPRRFMTVLYAAEALTLFGLAGFAYVTSLWHVLVVGFVTFGATVLSEVISDTNLQQQVPRALLGRVVGLEWFVAIGMAPLSFAAAGPLGRMFGARPVLVAIGVSVGTAVAALTLLPGALAPQQQQRARLHRERHDHEQVSGAKPSLAVGSGAQLRD